MTPLCDVAQSEIVALGSLLEQYHLQHRAYPRTLDELAAEYPVGDVRDPWDRPYVYTVRAEVPVIESAGYDGELGTDDDVTANGWQLCGAPLITAASMVPLLATFVAVVLGYFGYRRWRSRSCNRGT